MPDVWTSDPGSVYRYRYLDDRTRMAAAADEVADWLNRKELEGLRPRSLTSYGQTGRKLLRLFPNMPSLALLSPGDIEAALSTFPPASRHIRRGHISSLFNFLDDRELLPAGNPMRRVAKIRKPIKKMRPAFTEPERDVLVAADWKMAVLFLSGIRNHEARALQGRDVIIDMEPDGTVTGRLTLRTAKGGKPRTIQMRKLAVILNDAMLLEGIGPDDYLWESHPGGGKVRRSRQVCNDTLYKWFYETLEKVGVPEHGQDGQRRTPHSTRHTFAYLWIAARGSIERLKKQLGHASIETTFNLYVDGHLTADDIRSDLELVEG